MVDVVGSALLEACKESGSVRVWRDGNLWHATVLFQSPDGERAFALHGVEVMAEDDFETAISNALTYAVSKLRKVRLTEARRGRHG